jgi:hypothetical protein
MQKGTSIVVKVDMNNAMRENNGHTREGRYYPGRVLGVVSIESIESALGQLGLLVCLTREINGGQDVATYALTPFASQILADDDIRSYINKSAEARSWVPVTR